MTYKVSSGTLNLCSLTLASCTTSQIVMVIPLVYFVYVHVSYVSCHYVLGLKCYLTFEVGSCSNKATSVFVTRRQCVGAAFAMAMRLCVFHVDILCPDDRVDHHATCTRL